MRRDRKRRIRELERRVDELEGAVFARDWADLPPPIKVDMPDMPRFDFPVPPYPLDDGESINRFGYL